MPSVGLAALPARRRAAPLGELPAAPVPTLPAHHSGPWVLSGTTQGDSPSLLPWSPCLASVPQGIPGAGVQGRTGRTGLGTAASQACSSL